MKKLLIIMFCIAGFALAAPASAQSTPTFVETTDHSVFQGLFRSVWARLRSLSPASKESARSAQVYTAGIRGAESTDTLLKPYWKGDLTSDEQFQAELQQFSLAQLKMDQGQLEGAVKSFDAFLGAYAQSNLRPNALFGKSISLAGLGQTDQSRATLTQFIDENPNHPLVADARQILAQLN